VAGRQAIADIGGRARGQQQPPIARNIVNDMTTRQAVCFNMEFSEENSLFMSKSFPQIFT
jgi:hypothetical protein